MNKHELELGSCFVNIKYDNNVSGKNIRLFHNSLLMKNRCILDHDKFPQSNGIKEILFNDELPYN